jgi:hypothetical protein
MSKTPHERLGELRGLSEGWDSYGAPPIDPRALKAAESFLCPLFVPTSPGGVGVEVHLPGGAEVCVELDADGAITSFTVDPLRSTKVTDQ